MSELTKKKVTQDASTNKKIPPPKSLEGDHDAEVTWDLILTRYPNAAPLLCEMETVIERAEGLLRQLRSPYTHALERSSSFQIADSEDELPISDPPGGCGNVEESTEVSMISEQDSRLMSNSSETFTEVISESKDIGRIKRREEEEEEEEKEEEKEEESIFEQNLSIDNEDAGNSFRDAETVARFDEREEGEGVTSEEARSLEIGKSLSLEAWNEVVGEKKISLNSTKETNPTEFKAKAEDTVSEHARRLRSLKSGPIQQITKLNYIGKKEELVKRFAGTIANATKLIDSETQGRENFQTEENFEGSTDQVKINQEIETLVPVIKESGERNEELKDIKIRTNEVSDESMNEKTEIELEDRVQGNGDEVVGSDCKPEESEPRSAIQILDEYSKLIEVQVKYENLTPSCSYNKSFIAKCTMGGFSFEACSQSRKAAKTTAAEKLLRCLAGRQIDGENSPGLKPLTRKQIEEIISLGNGGERETAIRKLYKICLEENFSEPVYETVQQSTGIHGNRYTVKCEALGYTTSGSGIRVMIAKRVAADELLHTYLKNRNPVN